jgi:hypothetical protein
LRAAKGVGGGRRGGAGALRGGQSESPTAEREGVEAEEGLCGCDRATCPDRMASIASARSTVFSPF